MEKIKKIIANTDLKLTTLDQGHFRKSWSTMSNGHNLATNKN
jgi:hypothetical protein